MIIIAITKVLWEELGLIKRKWERLMFYLEDASVIKTRKDEPWTTLYI